MSYKVDIKIHDSHRDFYVGDYVVGRAEVTVPEADLLSDIQVSFHCLGEVKWLEYVDAAHFLQSHVYYDKFDYHEDTMKIFDSGKCRRKFVNRKISSCYCRISTPDVTVTPVGEFYPENKWKIFSIPFSFKIPTE